MILTQEDEEFKSNYMEKTKRRHERVRNNENGEKPRFYNPFIIFWEKTFFRKK